MERKMNLEQIEHAELEIVNFLNKISSQDNRCTASPYFYVVRTKSKFPVGRDDCDDPEDSYQTEDYDEFEYYNYDFETIDNEEYLELSKDQRQIVFYKEYWEEKNMFLTESDAKEHLRLNHYHYSSDAHTYVKHCWRAPEMNTFIKNLFNYFNIPKGNLDLKGIAR